MPDIEEELRAIGARDAEWEGRRIEMGPVEHDRMRLLRHIADLEKVRIAERQAAGEKWGRDITEMARQRNAETRKLEGMTELKDAAYRERNMCVSLIARMAVTLGLETYVRIDEDEPEEEWKYNVGIELPVGQVTFHVHQSELGMFDFLVVEPKRWDGHTSEEKWRRVLSPGPLLKMVTMRRASGEMPCAVCGKLYRQHPWDVNHIDVSTGEPWLHVLCDGSRVKL